MITLISRSKDQVLLTVIMVCQKLVSLCSVKKHKKHSVLDISGYTIKGSQWKMKKDRFTEKFGSDKDISLLCACAYVWEY